MRSRLSLIPVGLNLLVTLVAVAPTPAAATGISTSGIRLEECVEPVGELSPGISLALLCDPAQRSTLDAPINPRNNPNQQTRAGSFSLRDRAQLLVSARPALGEARFRELRAFLLVDDLLSFDAAIPELLETRIDPPRLPALLDPNFGASSPTDGVSEWGFASAPTAEARFSIWPVDVFTVPGVAASSALQRLLFELGRGALPVLTGPDGVMFNTDDLPCAGCPGVSGLTLGAPIGNWTFGGNFSQVAFIDGTLDGRPGLETAPLVLYGVRDADLLAQLTCRNIFPGFFRDPVTARRMPIGFIDVDGACANVITGERSPHTPAELSDLGCETAGGRGGINDDGDCIVLNTLGGTSEPGVHFGVVERLGDLSLRPAGAQLEPADQTDFLLRGLTGLGLPARPWSATGALRFPESGGVPGRRVDPATGAPVRASGALVCVYRSADGAGTGDPAQSLGPDGVAGTNDDVIPSFGNCLLFDNPTGAEPQALRSRVARATDHSADQRLFHTLCTASFDDDTGNCPLDSFNDPAHFVLLGLVLWGSGGGLAASLAVPGVESIAIWGVDDLANETIDSLRAKSPERFSTRPSVDRMRRSLIRGLGGSVDVSFDLDTPESALLGCGPAFATPCGGAHTLAGSLPKVSLNRNPADRSVLDLLGVSNLIARGGGIDLQSTDATVFFSDWAVSKATAAGELVGSRDDTFGLRFEAGIASDGLDPTAVIGLGEAGRAAIVASGALTDAWIEPMPWALDPDSAARGELRFQVADQTRTDPRCDPELHPRNPDGTHSFSAEEIAACQILAGLLLEVFDPDDPGATLLRNDPTDPSNPANVLVSGGESCSAFIERPDSRLFAGTAFDAGCTPLEGLSANIERARVARDIIGQDRVFDPPETWEELRHMIDADPNTDGNGDPIAGPDGIFVWNFDAFPDPDQEVDIHAVVSKFDFFLTGHTIAELPDLTDPNQIAQLDLDLDGAVSASEFFASIDPSDCDPAIQVRCFLDLGQITLMPPFSVPQIKRLAAPIPVSEPALVVDSTGSPTGATTQINLLALQHADPSAFSRLLAGGFEVVTAATAILSEETGEPLTIIQTVPVRLSRPEDLLSSNPFIDFDSDGHPDLDVNRDGVYDGDDDFTPGPVSDDAILCGSGLPGDFLQNAAQLEPFRRQDLEALNAAFPDGLPRRSPTRCGALQRMLGLTAEGPSGRRDFRWHREADPCAELGGDSDEDGICDADDNCPFAPNPDQLDAGGVRSYRPDGIGDVCQCGDVSDDGRVDNRDARFIIREIIRRPQTGSAAEKCNVTGTPGSGPGSCSVRDLIAVVRAGRRHSLPLEQICGPALP